MPVSQLGTPQHVSQILPEDVRLHDTCTLLIVASSYIPTSNNYLPAPWVSDMAGSDTSVTGSCHCDSDRTGSCAVEEDKAEETGRKEWVGKSLHELDSEEYAHEQF